MNLPYLLQYALSEVFRAYNCYRTLCHLQIVQCSEPVQKQENQPRNSSAKKDN